MGVIQNAVDSAITTATSMSYNNAFRKSMANVESSTKSMVEQQQNIYKRINELSNTEKTAAGLEGLTPSAEKAAKAYNERMQESYSSINVAGKPETYTDANALPYAGTPEQITNKYNPNFTTDVNVANSSMQAKATITAEQQKEIEARTEALFKANGKIPVAFIKNSPDQVAASRYEINDTKIDSITAGILPDDVKSLLEKGVKEGLTPEETRKITGAVKMDKERLAKILRGEDEELDVSDILQGEDLERYINERDADYQERLAAEEDMTFDENKEYTVEDIDKLYDNYESKIPGSYPIKMNDNGEFELRHYTDQLPDTTYTDDEISKTALSNLIEMAKDKSDEDIENIVENKFNIANKDELENAVDELRENINSEDYDTDQGKFNFSNGYFADQLDNDLKNIDEYDKLLKVEAANAPYWKANQIKETETSLDALKKLKKSENKEFFIGKILNDWRLVSDDGLTMRLPFGSEIKFKQDFETTDDSNITIEGYAPKLLSDGNYEMRKIFKYKVSVPFFTEERRLPITYADGTEATNYDTFKLKTKDYYEDLAKTQDFINKCVRNLSDKPEKMPELEEKRSEIITELDRNLKNARKYEKYMEENKPEEWTKEAQDNAVKRRSKYVSDAMKYYYRYTKLYEEGKQYAELLNRLEKERKNKKGDK